MCVKKQTARVSAGQLAQEVLLVHVILEGLAAVDKDDWNFIVELAAKFEIRVDVDFAPGKSSAAGEFNEALLHHFAEVAPLARVNDDAARIGHFARIVA